MAVDREFLLKSLTNVMETYDRSVSIVDLDEPDQPLIWVNAHFCEVTGYQKDEILGRNCRFLQGGETCKKSTQRIRDCIDSGSAVVQDIVNYRKDGTTFWNRLLLLPNRGDRYNFFIGIQNDVTEKRQKKAVTLESQASWSPKTLLDNVNNPLAIVMGANDLLEGGGHTLDPALLEKSMDDSLQRISQFLDSLD